MQFLIPAPLWSKLATIRGRREGERRESVVCGGIAKLLCLHCVERERFGGVGRELFCVIENCRECVLDCKNIDGVFFFFFFVSVCCNNDPGELCSVLILLGFSS